jgi:hypothetical protein
MAIGDRIIAVHGEDVSYMNVAKLTTIMSRKSDSLTLGNELLDQNHVL